MAGKRELIKYLNQLSKEELIKEVEKLNRKFDNVKEYYAAELSEDNSALTAKYKKAIYKEFFPREKSGRPGEARSSVLRKIIADFSKISVFEADIIELILYRVEMAVEFSAEYGDIDEQFYTSAENYFDKVCVLIAKNKLENTYEDRCMQMIYKTRNFGWGFYDTLNDSWFRHCERNRNK